jgi:hypothetical protein
MALRRCRSAGARRCTRACRPGLAAAGWAAALGGHHYHHHLRSAAHWDGFRLFDGLQPSGSGTMPNRPGRHDLPGMLALLVLVCGLQHISRNKPGADSPVARPIPCVISSADRLLGVRVAAVQPLPHEVSKVVRLVRMTGEHRDHFLAQLHFLCCTSECLPPHAGYKMQKSRQSRTKLSRSVGHRTRRAQFVSLSAVSATSRMADPTLPRSVGRPDVLPVADRGGGGCGYVGGGVPQHDLNLSGTSGPASWRSCPAAQRHEPGRAG